MCIISQMDECVFELMIEGILDENVYDEVIDAESRAIAEEVLNEYDTKIRRRAIKEVRTGGGSSLCLPIPTLPGLYVSPLG